MAILKMEHWDTQNRLSRGGKSIMTYAYWTNFNRKRAMSGDFEILNKKADLYWWFQTNLTFEDFESMGSQALNRFMFQMYEYYKKSEEKDA